MNQHSGILVRHKSLSVANYHVIVSQQMSILLHCWFKFTMQTLTSLCLHAFSNTLWAENLHQVYDRWYSAARVITRVWPGSLQCCYNGRGSWTLSQHRCSLWPAQRGKTEKNSTWHSLLYVWLVSIFGVPCIYVSLLPFIWIVWSTSLHI